MKRVFQNKYLLVFIFALAISFWAMATTPLKYLPKSLNDDLLIHVECVNSMRDAIAEGQFPGREIPKTSKGQPFQFTRYPFFQFYSNLPYLLASIFVFLGATSYHALVITVFLSFVLGFIGSYKLSRLFGTSHTGALACGVGFTVAPYHLVDWYSRIAYPETITVGFIPYLFLGVLLTFKKPGKGPFILCTISWCAIMLSHNIFHLWSLVFLTILLLNTSLANKQKEDSFFRVIGSYVLAVLACSWFLFPTLIFGTNLIESQKSYGNANLSVLKLCTPDWDILFSPFPKGLYHLPNHSGEYLCLQLGWPLLIGALIFIYIKRKSIFKEPLITIFVFACLCIMFLYQIWNYIGPLVIVQYSYRLIAYAMLFSSLAVGLVIDRLCSRYPVLGLCLFIIICTSWFGTYRHFNENDQSSLTPKMVEENQKNNGTWIRSGYKMQINNYAIYSSDIPASAGSKIVGKPEIIMFKGIGPYPKIAQYHFAPWSEFDLKKVKKDTIAILPALYFPSLYQVLINGKKSHYGSVDTHLAVLLPQGDVIIKYRFQGLIWANYLSLIGWVIIGALVFLPNLYLMDIKLST